MLDCSHSSGNRHVVYYLYVSPTQTYNFPQLCTVIIRRRCLPDSISRGAEIPRFNRRARARLPRSIIFHRRDISRFAALARYTLRHFTPPRENYKSSAFVRTSRYIATGRRGGGARRRRTKSAFPRAGKRTKIRFPRNRPSSCAIFLSASFTSLPSCFYVAISKRSVAIS